MKYTEREREILNSWPTVTGEDLTRMNDLFPHYLFFRKNGDLMGLGGVKLYASCCGHKEYRPYLTRTETPEHRELLDHLKHKEPWICPWCGREMCIRDSCVSPLAMRVSRNIFLNMKSLLMGLTTC